MRGWHFFMSILIDPPQLHLVGFHMSIPRRSPRIVNQASTTLRQCWPNPFGAEREGCSLQYYHSALYNICRCVSFFVCLYSSLCLCLALCLLNFKGWGQSAKLKKQSRIWGKFGTAIQGYILNPCTKFPPNPTSRKVNNQELTSQHHA